MNILARGAGGLVALLLAAGTVASYHSTSTFELGAPGTAMQVVDTQDRLTAKLKANEVPPPLPPADEGGVLAVNAYKNVQVLGHVSAGNFTRLMTAITTWVAPNEGCAYCHAPQRDAKGEIVRDEDGYAQADLNNMQSDELYTKRVARRMIQMTQRINADWQVHVQQTGVTCYTCHRGNPVPTNIWFDAKDPDKEEVTVGRKAGQNAPSEIAGLASLPADLHPFLVGNENIRVLSSEAIGSENRASIKQTEWTYGLMMHMSKSLGVNCTYCHNSRSLAAWTTSPTTRTTAWYGIRMVREINNDYLAGLHDTFPQNRLGPLGDVPKANCATCHNGAYKPLLGVSMLKDYPVLAAPKPQPPKTATLNVNPAPLGTQVAPDAKNPPPTPDLSGVDAGALDAGPKPPRTVKP